MDLASLFGRHCIKLGHWLRYSRLFAVPNMPWSASFRTLEGEKGSGGSEHLMTAGDGGSAKFMEDQSLRELTPPPDDASHAVLFFKIASKSRLAVSMTI